MQKTINKNLLKYSAGVAIFCPICSEIADWRKWVIATQGHVTRSMCSLCWDVRTAGNRPKTVEIIDYRLPGFQAGGEK
jgi:hypothetical protein